MSRAHAILSPSASHRWLNCTAAPALEMNVPEQTSIYAEEGTLAHAICEAKLHELKGECTADEYYRTHDGSGKPWTEHERYKPEMEETSDYYRDIVAQKFASMKNVTPDALLLIEVSLDFTKWIPDGFGTADAIVVGSGRIDVIDYKHGMGVPVAAEHNPQMMTYAIGACEEFDIEYGIDVVTMTIVQPRIDNTSTWEIPYKSLLAWGDEVLTPKAREAFNGTLGCKTETAVGHWCRFCKVKAICKARADVAAGLVATGDPKLLSNKEISELLPRAKSVKDWCDDLEAHALGLIMNGADVEGYKVVEGRSLRKIIKPEELSARLINEGVASDKIYKPSELRALGELEKLVGKAKFAELSEGLIEKPKGKPTLAPATDKRAPYSTIENDFSHIINS